MTTSQTKQRKSTKLSTEQKAANLLARQNARKEAKELARITREQNQKPVKDITINIEWKKSSMWGSNPNCEAVIHFQDGSYERSPIFKCSGCGYDKESTVIADVFNSYLKYKLYGEFKPTGRDRDNGLPYGIYLGQYRHFSGGIGTDCYYSISEAINGKFERISSGKTFDVYKYTDNN